MEIILSSQSFTWIEVYKVAYNFDRNNSGPVICRDCRGEIGSGMGIHRKAYKRNGYLCFSCFCKDLEILTTRYDGRDAGFFIDSLGRLRACTLNSPSISTAEVASAVYKALLDGAYTTVDIMLGAESAHTWKLLDAAEAAVGR